MKPKKLSDSINNVSGKILKQRGFGDTRIITDWEKIVGEKIAAISSPIRIKYSSTTKEAALYVQVQSAFSLEFSYNQASILEKIITYFGQKIIDKIIITQSQTIQNHLRPNNFQHQKTLSCNIEKSVEEYNAESGDAELDEALKNLKKRLT